MEKLTKRICRSEVEGTRIRDKEDEWKNGVKDVWIDRGLNMQEGVRHL